MSNQGDDTSSDMSDTSYSFFDIEFEDTSLTNVKDTNIQQNSSTVNTPENEVIDTSISNVSKSNFEPGNQHNVSVVADDDGLKIDNVQFKNQPKESDLSTKCRNDNIQSDGQPTDSILSTENRSDNEDIAKDFNSKTANVESKYCEASHITTARTIGNEMDQFSEGEDNIPLSELRKRIHRKRHREPSTEHEFSDDELDKTYRPSKEDLNSSDSENSNFAAISACGSETDDVLPILSVPKQRKRRMLQHKKRRGSLDREKHRNISPKKKSALQIALARSTRTAQVQKIIEKYHKARLDKLLSSNGLKRIPMTADGNCFVNAVLHQINEHNQISLISLRTDIADHLRDHYDHYRVFRSTRSVPNHDDKMEYLLEVDNIRNSGTWNTNLADCMPLAVANITKRPIRIYSSNTQTPVIDVAPDLQEEPCTNNAPIFLACTAVRGQEHYDAVKRLDDTSSSEKEPTNLQKTPQRKESSQPQLITPHKKANYRSPCKRKLFRKRTPKTSEWKRNKRKIRRNKGLSYTSSTGILTEPRKVKSVDCSKCRFKCSSKISEENRQTLFSTYWNLADYEKQRSFLCQHIKQTDTKGGKRKLKANSFYFTADEISHRVCKRFFLKTLDVGKKTVEVALRNKCHGTFVGNDKRGTKASVNKTPPRFVDMIHEHIRSFPIMESHYSRAKTRKQYLSADLNIKLMYSLFKVKYFADQECPVKECIYRRIFCENYNLSFHKPKRDQCSTCTLYDQRKKDGNVDEETERNFTVHQQMKEWAREEKQRDKDKAKQDKTFHVSTFDLEAVLSTPCSLVGEVYYKRKLSCYNLSFYSLSDQKGICYLWDESQGGRGCCEIGSCVIKQISAIAKSQKIKEITLYSDTCGGQNRNQFMASGLLYALKQHPHLEKVNQKLFEPGQSQMESDSIHSAVEHAKKKTQVFVPSQWATVVSLARRNKPYTVIPLRFDDFYDLKALKSATTSNMKIDIVGKRVNWLCIKWIQVRKEMPNSLFVNYGFDPNQFCEIRVTRGRMQQDDICLTKCFCSKRPISVAKKNDLLSLCRSKIIPEEYHSYYKSLPTSKFLKDRIPDVDNSDFEEMGE